MNDYFYAIQTATSLIAPEIILLSTMCVLFFATACVVTDKGHAPAGSQNRWGILALLGLGCALYAWSVQQPNEVIIGPFRNDSMTWYVRGVMLSLGVVLVLLNWNSAPLAASGESQACVLAICAGVNLAAAANDLTLLVLALELVSIPTYLFLFLPAKSLAAQEAALKYFLLSMFSSALFLFGASWLYGMAGTTSLPGLQAYLWNPPNGQWSLMGVTGLLLVVAGLSFRITAVPFHFYAPDVFEGAVPACSALLAFVPKVAGFVGLLRLAAPPLEGVDMESHTQLLAVLRTLAFLTMFLGNGLALLQSDLRRVLAYSSVAHAGYMLVGLSAGRQLGQPDGVQALLFYLATYGVMTLGLFGVVIAAGTAKKPIQAVDDLAGLGSLRPGLAAVAVVLLLSLAGLPPTAGFLGKFQIFWSAWSQGSDESRWMAFWLAINAAIGAWYYLRLIGVVYLRDPANVPPAEQATSNDAEAAFPAFVASGLCAAAVFGLFFVPGALWSGLAR